MTYSICTMCHFNTGRARVQLASSLTLALSLMVTLAACNGGFKEVDDAGTDAAGQADLYIKDTASNDSEKDLAQDLGADAGGGCSKLVVTSGPVILGFGDAESTYSATAATSTHVATVWEQYYPGGSAPEGSTYFAAQELSGKTVVKELELDKSEYPPLPTMAAINDDFGVVHVRKDQEQQLQYLRVDVQGTIVEQKLLASGLGQYAAEPTMAAGPAGIAVGYTTYDDAQKSQMHLGMIDGNGEITRAFATFPQSGTESRHLKLLATDTGFVAVWTELRPNDLRAVMAAWLDSSLNVVSSPGEVVVTEDDQIHQRPAAALNGDGLLVCHESLTLGQDADVTCRRVAADGTPGPKTISSLAGLSARRPQVVAVGGRFALLWTGVTTGLEEVHLRLLSADGSPVADSERISEPGVRSWYPSVTRVGQSLVASWYRYVPITVYFASFRLSCESG